MGTIPSERGLVTVEPSAETGLLDAICTKGFIADHLGRRIKLDRSDDDRTFAIARTVRIRHKQIGDSDETETRLILELVGDQHTTPRFNRLGVVELL